VFQFDAQLQIIPSSGGSALRVVSAPSPKGLSPDGRGLHRLLPQGFSACWSPDGRWLYHVRPDASSWHIEKIPAEGGSPVRVRTGGQMT